MAAARRASGEGEVGSIADHERFGVLHGEGKAVEEVWMITRVWERDNEAALR
jgi:hypothetical protein